MTDLTDADRAAIDRILLTTLDVAHTTELPAIALYRAGLVAGRARMRDEAALLLNLSRSDVQLMAGEITAQEWRTVCAILVNRLAAIRALP